MAEVEELDTQKVKDLLSELSAEQVMEIVGGVLADMLSGLKVRPRLPPRHVCRGRM